jgi:hypothetical protein
MDNLQKLLDSVRDGDMTAFEALYETMKKPLFTIILRITHDVAMSEDIMQDMFLKIYLKTPSSVSNPRAYLCRIDSSKYSWNELLRVQAEITALMVQDFNAGENNPDSGIHFSGTGWTNTDGVVHGFGENRREMRVTVGVDESMYDYYSELFAELYGDMVVVMVSGPIMPGFSGTDDLLMEDGSDAWGNDFLDTLVTVDSMPDVIVLIDYNNTSLALFVILGFGLLGIITTLIRIRARRINAMQTTSGDIITEGKPVSKKQIITAVKDSGYTPRDNLLNAIIEEIEKK